MKSSQALAGFAAISQETRLAILRLLIKIGPEGLPAGEIAAKLGVPAPTLSFHVASLERAGLVTSRRVQRQIIYAPDFEGVRALVSFLLEDCCGGRTEICAGLFSGIEAACGPSCETSAKAPTRKKLRKA
jgi:DNA-binding transcriptional ArsR family regulator